MSSQSGFGASLFLLIGVVWFYRRSQAHPGQLSAATQLKRGEHAWLNTVQFCYHKILQGSLATYVRVLIKCSVSPNFSIIKRWRSFL